MGLPCARKKLKHMAPPISTASASSRKRSMSAILSETFAPPRTTTSGPLGRLDDPAERGDLALQQQPGRRGQVLGHARGAGVGAVGGAEGVVHVDVGERGQAASRAPDRSRSLPAPSGCSRAPAPSPPRALSAFARASSAHHVGRLVHRRVDQLRPGARRRAAARSRARDPSAGRDASTGSDARRARAAARWSAARRGCARRRPPGRSWSRGTLKSTRTSARAASVDIQVADGALAEPRGSRLHLRGYATGSRARPGPARRGRRRRLE